MGKKTAGYEHIARKRGRPAKTKAYHLRDKGYTYKLDILTPEEKEEWENGRTIMYEEEEVTVDSTDYDYFFKDLHCEEGIVMVKIYHVGGKYYWNDSEVRLAYMLDIVEGKEKQNAKYAALQAQVKDTVPVEIDKLPSMPGVPIKFEGGILDGKSVQYNNTLPYYAVQLRDRKGKPFTVRYRRKEKHKFIYEYEKTI